MSFSDADELTVGLQKRRGGFREAAGKAVSRSQAFALLDSKLF